MLVIVRTRTDEHFFRSRVAAFGDLLEPASLTEGESDFLLMNRPIYFGRQAESEVRHQKSTLQNKRPSGRSDRRMILSITERTLMTVTVAGCGNHRVNCANGETTMSDYICDRDNDCGDNSDEICQGTTGK